MEGKENGESEDGRRWKAASFRPFVSPTTQAYAAPEGGEEWEAFRRGNSRGRLNLPAEFMAKLFKGCLVALNL